MKWLFLVSPLLFALYSMVHSLVGHLVPLDFAPAFKDLTVKRKILEVYADIYNEANIS